MKSYGYALNGRNYELDLEKGTCRPVAPNFEELEAEMFESSANPIKVYADALQRTYPKEEMKVRGSTLTFRGYKITCSVEEGFLQITDTRYTKLIDTPFDGLPSPKELCEYFKTSVITHTPEELAKAIERGKELEKGVDYKEYRKKALRTLKKLEKNRLSEGDTLRNYLKLFPHRSWEREARKIVGSFEKKEILFKTVIKRLTELTETVFVTLTTEQKKQDVVKEAIEIVEAPSKTEYEFVGAMLPEFKYIGGIRGTEIYVDDKWIPAMPFLLDFYLHYAPDTMYQVMKWGKGEITFEECYMTPIVKDFSVSYNKKVFKNTVENIQRIQRIMFDEPEINLVPPHLLEFSDDLKEGDSIMVRQPDGDYTEHTVTSVEEGIEYRYYHFYTEEQQRQRKKDTGSRYKRNGVWLEKGLLKTDLWYKVED